MEDARYITIVHETAAYSTVSMYRGQRLGVAEMWGCGDVEVT
jgi:hypothetical protein